MFPDEIDSSRGGGHPFRRSSKAIGKEAARFFGGGGKILGAVVASCRAGDIGEHFRKEGFLAELWVSILSFNGRETIQFI
jgi:hypothetical protein